MTDTNTRSRRIYEDITAAAAAAAADQKTTHHDIEGEDNDNDDDERVSISSSILDYYPSSSRRQRPLPPVPDLRFEQSYLASITPANGVWWKVALITAKDQMLMPLLQGLGFNLVVVGWKSWNRGVRFHGAGLGGEWVPVRDEDRMGG
jgi:hypothetical protein